MGKAWFTVSGAPRRARTACGVNGRSRLEQGHKEGPAEEEEPQSHRKKTGQRWDWPGACHVLHASPGDRMEMSLPRLGLPAQHQENDSHMTAWRKVAFKDRFWGFMSLGKRDSQAVVMLQWEQETLLLEPNLPQSSGNPPATAKEARPHPERCLGSRKGRWMLS